MKATTHLYLFEDDEVEVTYDRIGPEGALIRIKAGGQEVSFGAQRGKLLGLLNTITDSALEEHPIVLVSFGTEEEQEELFG